VNTSIGEWLQHPPGWMVAALLAILVGHLLKHLLDILNHAKDNTIGAMEIIVTLGLIAATFHQAYENNINSLTHPEWYESPFTLVCVLVVFGLLSGILIIVQNKFSA
jgi:H+/Cl- antiporter ClcA